MPRPARERRWRLRPETVRCCARHRTCRAATGTGDPACAAANTAAITTPWLTAAKTTGVGHSLPTAQFFEGGLNLTDSGLGGKCFNVAAGRVFGAAAIVQQGVFRSDQHVIETSRDRVGQRSLPVGILQ